MKSIIDGFGFIYGNSIMNGTSKPTNGYINSIQLTNDTSVIDIGTNVTTDGTTVSVPSFAIFIPTTNLPNRSSDNMTVHIEEVDETETTITNRELSIKNSVDYNKSDISSTYINLQNVSVDNASYELLRTNPKLTGNIKVVIDSENDIYIDTFKVNDALSKEKYRKVPVSYKDYYGSNVMSIFRNVQSKDLYDVPQKYHSLFTVTNNFSEQYVDVYRCGAALNTDKMYKENYSLLAPLRVGEILPDFFVIYKVNNCPPINLSSTDTMKYLIKNGEQIAFFDFREGTRLGTYLRNIQEGAKTFTGEAYIAKNGSDDNNYENIFSGISVDKGVVANVYESVVFNDAQNQVSYNNYFSKGYERNRLVSPNIINFEYMFDDVDEKQFSINTYYGVYLKFNALSENIYCFDASRDMSGDVIKTQNYVFKREGELVRDTDNVYSVEFPNDVISAYTSKDWIRRRTIQNRYTILDDTLPNVENKYCVGDNLLSLTTKEVVSQNAKTSYSSFVTITLNEPLSYGEHLKVVCHTKNHNLHSDSVYEVILTDASLYAKEDDGLSDETINYYTHKYKTSGDAVYERTITVHRICYYFEEIIGESSEDAIKRQVIGINKAFKSFTDCPVKSQHANDTTLSIVEIADDNSPYEYLDFQRITPSVLKDSEEITDESIYSEDTDKVTYFGEYSISPVIINPLIDSSNNRSWVYKEDRDLGFCPIGVEVIGTRLSYVVRFMDTKGYDLYEVSLKNPSDEIMYGQLYYIDDRIYADNTPREAIPSEYSKFSLVYHAYNKTEKSVVEITKQVNVITSLRNTNLKLVKVKSYEKDKKLGVLDKINLYNPYILSYGVCGFLPVKDFNFNVLDNENENDDSEVLSWYIDTDVSIKGYYIGDSSVKWNDYSKRLSSTNPTAKEDIERYLNLEYTNGRRYNDISLTSPYCMKWKFFNTDIEGRPIKAYYTDSYIGVKKYLDKVLIWDSNTPSTQAIKRIKSDKIDLSKSYNGDYIRENILYGKLSIKDVIYNESIRTDENGTVSDIEHIRIYSTSNNNIEFIYRGVKINVSLSNEEIINAQDLLNFNAYVYESYSCGGENEWEIFIDRETTSVLFIRYGIQKTINDDISKVKVIRTLDNDNNAIFTTGGTQTGKANMYWCRVNLPIDSNDLYMNDGCLKLSVKNYSNVPIPTSEDDICILMHSDNFTIRGTLKKNVNEFILESPFIYVNMGIINAPLSNDLLDNYCQGHQEMNIFAVLRSNHDGTNSLNCSNATTFEFKDIALYIKNENEEYKDYTNTGIMSVSLELPKDISTGYGSYSYYQTYFVPEVVDIFDFDGISELGSTSIGANFLNSKYANIVLSSVNDINQMWIEKYSENTNYCFGESDNIMIPKRVSFSVIKDYNVMMNPLYKTFNHTHTYTSTDDEQDMPFEGYKSGVFIKTFFNSLGLQLRSPKYRNVEIKNWSQTKLINNKFRFDVTNSLINMILNSAVFNELWNNIGVNNNTYKLNFIKKTILPNINISTKDSITVYVNRYKNKGLISSRPSSIFIKGMEEVKNIKAELVNEGGNYYVDLTPDKNINGTYYIKYNINL